MNAPASYVVEPVNRRQFLERFARSAAALAALPALFTPSGAGAANIGDNPSRALSGSQRRWRTAFGLNGFQSSEDVFKQTFPIWEVLEFAQREGFEGIELIPGWLKGVYPEAGDDARIASLCGFLGRYNVKAFSIQTFGAEAFQQDRSVREAWVKKFAGLAEFARKAGCECIGYWPGGDLGGQTVDEAIDSLVWSLKEMGRIVTDADLMLSVEIEPPFAFNKIEHLIRMLDGADHPRVKGMFDPSHFDLMNGSTGKPHELLERLGVQRVGYVHFTDTDGTLFHGTSKHLPASDGHIDVRKAFEVLWKGGYQGWIMIDPWMTPDPYDACRKGRAAIESARRELSQKS
jgi:sugar phosphate isomerase/epimerase